MNIILGIIGIIISFFFLVKRETIGDMIGEAEWMQHIGGVYNFIIVIGVLIFFWGLAMVTGTIGLLFAPIVWFFTLGRGTGQ